MNEAELREKCGLEEGQLINTNLGLLDILKVENGLVSLGVMMNGDVIVETIEDFMKKMSADDKPEAKIMKAGA